MNLRRVAAVLCLALFALAAPAVELQAQDEGAPPADQADATPSPPAEPALEVLASVDRSVTGIELTHAAQRELQRLEELWLQWMSAWVQGDAERAGSVVDQLLSTTRELGFESLPDLSLAALARAYRAAESGDFTRADWGLAAADRLDPGRPATAFAHAAVERQRGNRLTALRWDLKGLWRWLGAPELRRLNLVNLGLWVLLAVAMSAVLFLALLMATHGGGLMRDAVRFADRLAPRWLAYVLAVVGLLWPLLLPYGPIWLVLFWSVVLWGYGSSSERGVIVALWILMAATPFALSQLDRRATIELLPPVQAVESLRQHRLYGALLTDVGLLSSMQPASVPVQHLLADLHRVFGQWDLAQPYYREVLKREPDTASILVNLGAYQFLQGDYTSSIESFQKAVDADPGNAAALYNLSQAFNEGFLYSESRAMLDRAVAIDEKKVGTWLKRAGPDRVLTFNGGVVRGAEIRSGLRAQRDAAVAQQGSIAASRRLLTPLLVVVLLAAAIGLHLARRKHGYSDLPEWAADSSRLGERLVRVLVPGLDSAQKGHGILAYLAWLPPVGLLLLPLGARWLFRLPWGFEPGSTLLWWLAILGLVALFAVRLVIELSPGDGS